MERYEKCVGRGELMWKDEEFRLGCVEFQVVQPNENVRKAFIHGLAEPVLGQ